MFLARPAGLTQVILTLALRAALYALSKSAPGRFVEPEQFYFVAGSSVALLSRYRAILNDTAVIVLWRARQDSNLLPSA